jgi:hypothetical protein
MEHWVFLVVEKALIRLGVPQITTLSWCPWLMPVILATQEEEIRRITV